MRELAEQHSRRAEELYRQGQLNQSITEWRRAIEAAPDWSEAHARLGVALWYNGERSMAVAEYQEALRLDPASAKPRYNLGLALHNEGRIDEAIDEYRLALQSEPDYVAPHVDLGNAYLSRGEIAASIGEYQKAISLEPDNARAHAGLAATLKEQRDWDEAIAEYEEASRLKPDRADWYKQLGDCFSERAENGIVSDWPMARDAYQKALSLEPTSARIQWSLAVTQWHLGENKSAVETMEAAVKELGEYVPDAYMQLFWMQWKGRYLLGACRTLMILILHRRQNSQRERQSKRA